jgi:hypothetical protein
VNEDNYWLKDVFLLNDVDFVKNVTIFKIETLKPEQIDHLNCYVPVNRALRAANWKIANTSFTSFAAVRALSDWVFPAFGSWFTYLEVSPKK